MSGEEQPFLSTEVQLVLGTMVLATFINYIMIKRKNHPFPRVPGEWPFLGHLPYLMNRNDFQKNLEGWADTYGAESGIYEVTAGNIMPGFFVLCREDTVFEINDKRPFAITRASNANDVAKSVGVKGLFSSEGKEWQMHHRLIGPALTKKSIQDYMPVFYDISNKVIEKWTAAAKRGEIIRHIEDDLTRCLADSFSIVALERNFDFLNHPESSAAKDVFAILAGSNLRSFMPFPYWKIPIFGQYLDGVGFSKDRLEKLMNEVLDDLEAKVAAGDDGKSSAATKGDVKRSFIRKLYSTMKSEKMQLSREDTIGNMMTLFIGGTDSTAKSTECGLFHLAKDPELLQQLKEEAEKIDIENVTLDILFEQIPRIKSFLHEQHRLFGVPMQLVEAAEPIELKGHTFPTGTKFMILLTYVTSQKQSPTKDVPLGPNGEQPWEFCATRWLRTDEKGNLTTPTPTGHAVLGFGHGARICPGKLYSEAMSLLIWVRLLKTFKNIELTEPADSYYKVYDLMTKYNKPVDLKMTV